MRDKRVNGNFQLAFPACTRLFCLVLRIALSLAAPAGDNDGQAVFPAQPVADVAYAVIAPLVGIVLAVVDEIDRTKNHMVMDMPLVYVGSQHIFVLPLCYRVGKLPTYLMRLFITDFPRLKGLHEVVG